MKTQMKMFVAIASALTLGIGCSKNEEVSVPPPAAADAPASAVQKAVDTAQTQTELVKEKAADVTAKVQAEAESASAKVQDLIEQARKYLGENKASEALAVLNQLAGFKLTPDQQALIESLKAQAQKAVQATLKSGATEEATKAAGGLLKK
jgi:hypothetical protein